MQHFSFIGTKTWHSSIMYMISFVFFLWYQKYLPVGTFLFVSIFFTLARSQLRLKLVSNNQLGVSSLSQLFNITENESFVEIIILDLKNTYRYVLFSIYCENLTWKYVKWWLISSKTLGNIFYMLLTWMFLSRTCTLEYFLKYLISEENYLPVGSFLILFPAWILIRGLFIANRCLEFWNQ